MSRMARRPLEIPSGVEFKLDASIAHIKGPKGSFMHEVHPAVEVKLTDAGVIVSAVEGNDAAAAMLGTTCALLRNKIIGVSTGFSKALKLVGVGYRAKVQGETLELTLGYSHPIKFKIPTGITITSPSNTDVIVEGADKQQVGQVAAKIREFREPEVYKGKGVRYVDEQISLKETKKK